MSAGYAGTWDRIKGQLAELKARLVPSGTVVIFETNLDTPEKRARNEETRQYAREHGLQIVSFVVRGIRRGRA